MKKQELHSNFNGVFRLVYHLVLVTKFRRRILTNEVILRAKEVLSDLCVSWQGTLIECNGEEDHLHALLDMPPKVRPSDLVNNLKTVTSRRLRSEFPSLRDAYRNPVLWSPSYCIISAGGAPLEILRQYVENQEKPDL